MMRLHAPRGIETRLLLAVLLAVILLMVIRRLIIRRLIIVPIRLPRPVGAPVPVGVTGVPRTSGRRVNGNPVVPRPVGRPDLDFPLPGHCSTAAGARSSLDVAAHFLIIVVERDIEIHALLMMEAHRGVSPFLTGEDQPVSIIGAAHGARKRHLAHLVLGRKQQSADYQQKSEKAC